MLSKLSKAKISIVCTGTFVCLSLVLKAFAAGPPPVAGEAGIYPMRPQLDSEQGAGPLPESCQVILSQEEQEQKQEQEAAEQKKIAEQNRVVSGQMQDRVSTAISHILYRWEEFQTHSDARLSQLMVLLYRENGGRFSAIVFSPLFSQEPPKALKNEIENLLAELNSILASNQPLSPDAVSHLNFDHMSVDDLSRFTSATSADDISNLLTSYTMQKESFPPLTTRFATSPTDQEGGISTVLVISRREQVTSLGTSTHAQVTFFSSDNPGTPRTETRSFTPPTGRRLR